MPYFHHDGLEFHYLERGDGVPVFFQHGLGSDAQKIFDLLALPSGFRLLSMDCRAHGNTRPLGSPERLRFDVFADDLIGLQDELGISRAVLGGTSMGAGLALNCALRYPQRVLGLVLLRPAWLDKPNLANAELFGLIAQLIREHGPKEGLARFLGTAAYAAVARESSDVAASLAGLFQEPRAVETVARLERIPHDAPNFDRSAWRSISVPTLVLTTAQDPVHPLEFGQILSREMPLAQFRELTPKSANLAQYTTDLRSALAKFLQAEVVD